MRRMLKKIGQGIGFCCLFLMTLVLLGLLCTAYYFPNVTFNQIVFHVLYLDSAQLAFWQVQIAGVLLLSLIGTIIVYKKRFAVVLLILVFLTTCFMFRVSDIKEDKPISLAKQIYLSMQTSDIYEKYYQTPESRVPENKKNVIVIFAESMEDSFADEKYWGENLIPNLSKLKKEGISFKGYYSLNGTNWTLASNVSTFCGVPLRMQLRDKLGLETKQFIPNAKCLPDLTHELGYYNVFVTSTYLSFVGTDVFVSEHHFDEIYGNDEIIAEGDATFNDVGLESFGLNDVKLFEFARHKIRKLAQKDMPFLMSIQTLDTHFPSGWVHPSCKVKYGDTRDAIKCSDKIIYDFIRWCQKQDFWKNTVLIVVGDHLMMTSSDIAKLSEVYPNREIYNVILEEGVREKIIFKPYSMTDWSATIADKAGFVKDGKFGLGVSLLKNKETLTEKLGAQKFEEEVLKNSSVYNRLLGIHQKEKSDFDKEADFQLTRDKMIAHACGGIDGYVYTNSLEALNLSAERRYKYVEIDLLTLIDKMPGFFAAHDYEKFRHMTGGLHRLDRATLKKLKILDQYTPLTDDMIVTFFEKHPDMWLVTDKVTNYALLNERLGTLKNRTIIEFWTDEQYEEALKYGFKNLAYHLAWLGDIPLVIEKGYQFVTVSLDFLETYKYALKVLRQSHGVKVMVYTLKNKEEIGKYNAWADMFYYDGQEKLGK